MKWELTYTDDWDKAQELASGGWEMCGASKPGFLFGSLGFLFGHYYFFKRPLL